MHTTSSEIYDVVDFLLRLQTFDPLNPWNETEWSERGKTPDDLEALSGLLSSVLRSAHDVIAHGRAYACFEVPKGREKTRSIEAPDGSGATRKIDEWMQGCMEQVQEEKQNNIERILAQDFSGADAFGGLRSILAPGFEAPESMNMVRTAQQAVESILSPRLPFWPAICGFRYNSGTYDGLRRILSPFYHRKTTRIASVYQIDIRNFFPSVTEKMASDGLFQMLSVIAPTIHKIEGETLEKITKLLVRTGCYEWRLPQGGHLSPLLANCAAALLIDQEIASLLKSHQRKLGAPDVTLSFGRYADDIVVLSSEPMLEEFRSEIDAIVSKHFVIAEEKRLYQEGKNRYQIWGASLQADRQFERISFRSDGTMQWNCTGVDKIPVSSLSYTDFGFKLPKNIERRIVALTYECAHRMCSVEGMKELRDEGSELMQNFREVVGYFSHAYNISRSGGVITLGSDGRYYGLPKPLYFVWEMFKRISQEMISPAIFRDTFVIHKEENFETNRGIAERSRQHVLKHEAAIAILSTTTDSVHHTDNTPRTITSSREDIAEWLADHARAEAEFWAWEEVIA